MLPDTVELSSTGRPAARDESEDEDDASMPHPPSTTTPTAAPLSFPALEAALGEAIAALGGAVVPKLNWSVPRDATWVNGGSLKCETVGDVLLLLKSSDFVLHDLELLVGGCRWVGR